MADPLVLLVARSPGDATPYFDRLAALGFRCKPAESESAAGPEGPVVIVRIDAAAGTPRALPAPARERAPAGVPVLRVGSGDPAPDEDEVLSPGLSDDALARRLRIWGRWSALAGAERGTGHTAAGPAPASSLTSLPGHKEFMDRLTEEVKRHERYDAPLGVVLADIDGLREINTRYGHRTGDRVIREVGDTLSEAVRGSDRVFHYGGDTFALLLTHATAEATRRAVSRLRSVFASRILRGDPEGTAPPPLLKVSMSFGHVSLPEAGLREPAEIVAAAENALAAARTGAPGTTIPTSRP